MISRIMSKFFLQPVSYSVTYGQDTMEDYIWECEQDGATPTQGGFEKYAESCFGCMLTENFTETSSFDRIVVCEIVVFDSVHSNVPVE